MNETHKKALKINHPDLLQDLDLTADLVGKLIHAGILNEDMIEDIKTERTRKERVQKLLLILPRRGPRAFDKFVCALGEHYWWLADSLRKTYHKISLHTEPEMLSLKKKVDIYVHEQFGNSKRLCEDDKKEIRKFLYRYLKSHKEEDDPLFAVEQSRRNSLESNTSDFSNFSKGVSEKDIQVDILARVYSMFETETGLNQGEGEGGAHDEFDSVDGPADVTIDMIEKKVKDLNRKVDTLQNEINDCYSVLEVEKSVQPLNEVLQGIRDDRIVDRRRLGRLRNKLDTLEEQRHELEDKIQSQQNELNKTMHKLADAHHKNERADAQSQELKEKCEQLKEKNDKLEQIHLKHVEKQQTLMTLKSMVHELAPQHKQSQDPGWFKSCEKKVDQSVQLPKLSPVRVNRQGRQSLAATSQEGRSLTQHHEFPKPRINQHGIPWK